MHLLRFLFRANERRPIAICPREQKKPLLACYFVRRRKDFAQRANCLCYLRTGKIRLKCNKRLFLPERRGARFHQPERIFLARV